MLLRTARTAVTPHAQPHVGGFPEAVLKDSPEPHPVISLISAIRPSPTVSWRADLLLENPARPRPGPASRKGGDSPHPCDGGASRARSCRNVKNGRVKNTSTRSPFSRQKGDEHTGSGRGQALDAHITNPKEKQDMKGLRALSFVLLILGMARPAAAWGRLNDSEEPGSVLVFHKFARGFAGPFAKTDFVISVTCRTCPTRSLFGV